MRANNAKKAWGPFAKRKRNPLGINRGDILVMLADEFFHPYHVIPFAEFVTAVMKNADYPVAHLLMKSTAVIGKIVICSVAVKISNAGIYIKNAHIL